MKTRIPNKQLPILAAVLAVAGTQAVHAQLPTANRYWDPASSGNFGSINNTTVWVSPLNIVWTNSSNGGTTRLQNYTTKLTDICNWGGPMPPATPTNPLGGGTVPVGTVDAGWLSFNNISTKGVFLSGGTITLNATAKIIVNNTTFTHEISSTLAGAGTSMTKEGPGTIVLSGSNIYAGPTAVTAGTLTLGNTNALANSPLDTTNCILGDATNGLKTTVTSLTFGGLTGDKDLASVFTTTSGGFDLVTAIALNPGNAVTTSYTGVIADGAAGMTLAKSGAGTQALSGANNFTGSTTVNAGTLVLDYSTQDNSKLSDTGELVLGSGTIELAGGTHTEVVASTTLTGNSKVTRSSGSAKLALGAVSGTGSVDFSADNIATTTTPNNALGLLPFATIGGSNLAANDGSGNIVTFTGYADIDARGPSTVPNNPNAIVRIVGDGTSGNIALAAASTTIYNLLQSNANFAATIDTAGKAFAATALTVGSGAESLNIGVAAGDGTLSSALASGTLELTSANVAKTLTVNAGIVDNTTASAVSTAGAGTVILAGTNNYTGPTTVGGGTLVLSGSLTGSAVSVVSDAVLNQTSTGAISGAVTVTHNSTGASTLAGANSYSGATVINTGSVNIQNATALGDTAEGTTVVNGAALQLQNDITVGAEALSLAGSGVGGTGALRNISGTNTYGGPVTLTGPTLINSDAGSLTLSDPGSLTGATFTLSIGGAGNTTINSTIDTTSGSLAKTGVGTLTLTGANTFTGDVNITGGVVNIRNDTALGTIAGGVTVGSGAALELQGGVTVGNEPMTLAGTGVSNTGVIRNISGDNTLGGAITLTITTRFQSDAGTLILDVPSGNAIAGTGPATGAGANPPMIFSGDGNFTVADPIAGGNLGTGTLTKQGTGTLTFLAANTYWGPTVISAGLVSLENALAMQNSPLDTTASVAGDATNGLRTTATTLTLGGLIGDKNLADMFTTSSGGYGGITALTLNPGVAMARSYSGTIVDGAAGMTLTKSGAGLQTLSGPLNHTGATAITGGTLKLDGAASIASTPSITLGTGTGLDVSTLATPLSLGAGQTLKASGTGANTTATVTTVAANDLTLSAGGLVFSGYGGANGSNATNAPLTVTGTSAGELKLNGAPVTVTTTALLAPGTYVLAAMGGSAVVTGTPGALTVNGAGVDGFPSLAVTGGQLVLTVMIPSYEGWAANYPSLTNPDPSLDFDGDGLETGIEYVVGGDPTVNDAASVAPAATRSGSDLVFTFRRTDYAKANPNAAIVVEYSTDLSAWTKIQQAGSGVTIVENDDFYGPGIDQVVVNLRSSLAVNGKLFTRLKVAITLPQTLLSKDFEADDGGFTVVSTGGTPWEWGAPNSEDAGGGAVLAGNNGSAKCWGTNLLGGYAAGTDTSLRSPIIDLTGVTGATLTFAQAMDAPVGHNLAVNVLDTTGNLIAVVITPYEDPDLNTTPWKTISVPIPAGALGQQVRLEWRFIGNGTNDYLGAYIDDVVVTAP
jgi:autotransporter-associated beta strand protein